MGGGLRASTLLSTSMANIIIKGSRGVSRAQLEHGREHVRRRAAANQAREQAIAKAGHARAKKENASSNGFTKGKLFRHVARVPASKMRDWRREDKFRMADKKNMKKMINDGGYNTVRPGSF